MSTRYIEILATQSPFAFNVDESSRTVFSFNLTARAASPRDKWEEELIKLMSDAGLATLGTDAFIGPAAIIPAGAGPFITVIDTGGQGPDQTHDGQTIERLGAQVVVRASSYPAARTRILAIWRALDGVRDTTVAA